MEIAVADKAGACYGVNRALDMALAAAEAGAQPVQTLGPLIHNPRVVADLAANGVAEASSLDCIAAGTVVIRSHGTAPQVIDAAHAKGLDVVDATCPFVSKVQQTARTLGQEGKGVVIVGDAGHAEVEGIRAWGGDAVVAVVTRPEDLPSDLPADIGVVVQTTQSEDRFNSIVAALTERGCSVDAHKTICLATKQRQESAVRLSQQVDCMVVIGGRNSGNTRRLAELCSAACATHHIESEHEIEPSWFTGCAKVGVTAGASTPQAHIDAVIAVLERLA